MLSFSFAACLIVLCDRLSVCRWNSMYSGCTLVLVMWLLVMLSMVSVGAMVSSDVGAKVSLDLVGRCWLVIDSFLSRA